MKISNWTMLVFGLMAAITGVIGLLNPEYVLYQMMRFPVAQEQRHPNDYTIVFVTASSMASLNMGVYYVLAALTNLKSFFVWTVPFRCVTYFVFSRCVSSGVAPSGFQLVANAELVGAIATGTALGYERYFAK